MYPCPSPFAMGASKKGILVAAFNSGVLSTSADGITWTTVVNPLGTGFPGMTNGCYANGLFVIGDFSGDIITSPDGVNWTSRTSNLSGSSYAISYGAGLFVAVGQSGRYSTSPDGITWTSRSAIGGSDLRCITYANGYFALGTYNGNFYTSTNGTSWTLRTTGFSGAAILSVAYNSGVWKFGTSNGYVYTSSDFVSWSHVTLSGSQVAFMISAANYFFACDNSGVLYYNLSNGGWNTISGAGNTQGFGGLGYSPSLGLFLAAPFDSNCDIGTSHSLPGSWTARTSHADTISAGEWMFGNILTNF